MDRNNATSNFNLCLVISYDQKANQKFFEFSTNEIKISKKIGKCLRKLKKKKELKGFKNVVILQPFILHPGTSID